MLPVLLIAPIGPQGSGKEFLTKAIQNHCGEKNVKVVSTGGIARAISEDLRLENPKSRPTCNHLIKVLFKYLGNHVLATAVEREIATVIQERSHRVIVYDCPRRLEDEEMLTRFRKDCAVRTVALIRSEEDRYNALRERGRGDEGELTWQKFLANEELEQERFLQDLAARADLKLHCFGNGPQLDKQKEDFCEEEFHQYRVKSVSLSSV